MRVKVIGDDHLWTGFVHVGLEYCINVILFAIFDLDWNLVVSYIVVYSVYAVCTLMV